MPIQPLPEQSVSGKSAQTGEVFAQICARTQTATPWTIFASFIRVPDASIEKFSLSDAQLVIARSYGFASWSKLKQHLEVTRSAFLVCRTERPVDEAAPIADRFIRLACLDYRADHTDRRETGSGTARSRIHR